MTIRPTVLLLCFRLSIGLAFISDAAHAGTFFVSTSGDDNNNGTSVGTPWRTLDKVSTTHFNPGDQILFKRGDSWTSSNGGGQLTVASSGTSNAAQIVYGAYGTGNKPIFNGSGFTGRGASVSGMSYVTLQDLDFRDSTQQGVDLQACNYCTVLRVNVTSNGKGPAINARRGGNILIDGCVVTDARSNGIHFGGSASDRIHDSTIQNCTVNGTRANDGIVIHADSTPEHNPAGSNFIIRNNLATLCGEQGFDITTGTIVTLENNHSYANKAGAITVGHQASDVVVRYHRSENEPTANTAATLNVSTQNITVEYSRFVGSGHAKPIVNIKKHNLSQYPMDFLPENIVLRNNAFVWTSNSGGDILRISAENGTVELHNLTVCNNVFTSTTSAKTVINFTNPSRPPNYNGGSNGRYTFNNNVYYSSGGVYWRIGTDALRTFATYTADFSPADSIHSMESDPLFVNAGNGDFHLQSSSPAKDTACDTPEMLTIDFEGKRVPQGSARDIGLYEFPAVPNSPHSR